jgi:transposase
MDPLASPLSQITCDVRHLRYGGAEAPCDRCGRPALRVWDVERTAIDLALDHPVLLLVEVSVHHCAACAHYFRVQPPFLRPGTSYTTRVVAKAVASVYRDGMAIRRVSRRLAEDFWVQPSEAMIRHWCRAYTDGLDFAEAHQAEVIAEFSGVLCVDEVYHGELALLLAVDPAAPDGDRLVGYQLVQERRVRQEDVAEFLTRLRQAGVAPEEVITDRSNLYPAVLATVWPRAAHQLCLFHETRRVLRAAQEVVRSVRASIPHPPSAPTVRPGDPAGKPELRGRFRQREPGPGQEAEPAAADYRLLARQAAVRQVQALRRQGHSERAICGLTGFSRRAIHRWLGEPLAEPDQVPGERSPAAAPGPPAIPLPPGPPAPWADWDQVRRVRADLLRLRFHLLRRPDHLAEQEQAELETLYAGPVGELLRVVRQFVEGWYALWRDDAGCRRELEQARERFAQWRSDPRFATLPPLRRLLERLDEQEFGRLGAFLRHEHWEGTNNGAERMGRSFRHGQAPHFYLRTVPTLEGAVVAQAVLRHQEQPASLGSCCGRSRRGRRPARAAA